ncbi:MAG TPA: efflux RND transporter periplasmic adaptor subunit [Verrucomicrobiae bacterium]|jgi:RND family efflux transporter MFP subunit|nr:efflux RND transporter periplasmic adaptor subunit [Verrucomicrobiae bacterium]
MKEKLRRLPVRLLSAIGVVALVAAVLLLTSKPGKATASTGVAAVPSVAVVKVTREDLAREIKFPAEFRPYIEVELHAKVSGYLRDINVDFGDEVKAGQLLATIEIPELQDELNNAIATQQKAEADQKNAHLVYSRLRDVDKSHPNLVAQEELDTAESHDADTAAAVAAAKADVERYQTLVAYTRITAPFDGVVTHRYTDPGAMIQAGTASQAMPLLRLSDNYRLRLDFPVSMDYVQDVRVGDPVDVRIDSLAGKTFTGKISRFTHRVDETTRTMIAEMEVDNPKLELIPGMYATVVLKADQRPGAIAIPVEAVASGKTTVNVVDANNEVEQRTVTLGIETPTKYEVLSGVKEGDLVVVGDTGQIKPGEKVEPKLVSMVAAR